MFDLLLNIAATIIETIGDCIEDVDIDADGVDTDAFDSLGNEDYADSVSFCGSGDEVHVLEDQLASAESKLKTCEDNMARDINLGRGEYYGGQDKIDIEYAQDEVERLKNALSRARS
ncbi:hypothetical protein [uncultured Akkermansia sp.]|uniref:hypothetical protein n=1 Tax=Akkermansia sp. TaxID=1872421 RepID=UPI0025EFA47F|nr:hypothetical protein [uncultured Akkermansia sp.]